MKLQGLKVVDLSVFLPGPYLTLALADHGAEVIKVEQPGEGDPGRHIGLKDGPTTVFFRSLNRGKKSVVLDLKQAVDREALLRLCDEADVFVESFRPGVVKRLGCDYATLSARNRGLVYCSTTGADGRRWLTPPIRFAHEPARPTYREPALGEHTADVTARAQPAPVEP